MKKTLLTFIGAFAFFATFAQKGAESAATVTEHYKKYQASSEERSTVNLKRSVNPYVHNNKALGQTVLETTTYDLQTNSSVQDRIEMDNSGNVSAVWTASETTNFNDRGTGYAFYDGTTWNPSPDYPRIESVRTGWPSILYPASGGEIVISHSTEGDNSLKLNSRATRGTGSWTEKDISNRTLTWQRSAMGGPDGNSIHLVAITDTLDSAAFNNIPRALAYYRSTDGGSTFDIVDSLLPGMHTSSEDNIFADNYALAARGNVVAIGIFRPLANDVFILKSTNNGDTWTKTIVYDFPYADFDDFDNNFATTDTNAIQACDGSGAVLIDDNDMVHVSFGRLLMTNNDSLGDGIYTRTIFVDSLVYWNEGMGAGNYGFAGHIYDANEDGNANLAAQFNNLGDYRTSNIISMPSMAMGDDGKIWIAYSALTENFDDGGSPLTNLRHIFVINSDDDGASWSEPVDLNSKDEFVECVYPSMVKTVDDRIRVLYQRDNAASVVLVTPPTTTAPFARHTYQSTTTENEIVYYEIGTQLNVGVEKVLNAPADFSIYPNPATDQFNIATNFKKPAMVKISVTNILGKEVFRQETNQTPDQKLIRVNASELPAGIYLVNIAAEGKQVTQRVTIH